MMKLKNVILSLLLAVIGGVGVTWAFVHASNPPLSLWNMTPTPQTITDPDIKSVEIGTKFQTKQAGEVVGVAFYKGPLNTGKHTGNLWDAAGNNLASVVFTGETKTGWQQAQFEQPIKIAANTTYVISYHAPRGHYSVDENYFQDKGIESGPLSAPRSSITNLNGVYAYGSKISFPKSSYRASNYWVDVLFTPEVDPKPSAPSNVTVSQKRQGIEVAWSASNSAGSQVTTYKVMRNGQEIGRVNAPTLNFIDTTELDHGVTYTYQVIAIDATSIESDPSLESTITYLASYSLWQNTVIPKNPEVDDGQAVTLGVTFKTVAAGNVTGVKFYKGPRNIGTHKGSLWDMSGNKLSEIIFEGETDSGWQTAYFTEPIAITANTSYIVAYHTTSGYYAGDTGFFATDSAVSGPLTAMKTTEQQNGVYTYGASSAYPASSYRANNYWVDVLFTPTAAAAIPATPKNVTAVKEQSTIKLSWESSTSGTTAIEKYVIYRDSVEIGSVDGAKTEYVDSKDLVDGTTYGYQVKAVDSTGTPSNLSNSVGVTFETPKDLANLTRVAWEGGPGYYEKFPQAKAMGWTDPNFYPIGLWGAAVDEQWQIDSYKEVGINTFLELYTSTPNLALLRQNDMSVIHGVTNRPDMGNETVAWLLSDEPEQHEQEDPRKVIDYLNEQKKRFPENDGRMHFTNFTANMLWPTFPPGPEYTTKWLDANDANSIDIYWHARDLVCSGTIAGEIWKNGSGAPQQHGSGYNDLSEAECHRATNYGWQIDAQRRLSTASDKAEPVFGFVENGSPADTNPINGAVHTIAPEEMAGAMWNMIIHGASGINIFNHTLNGPCITSDNLNHPCYVAMREKTKQVTAQIRQLASVINTQSFDYKFNPLLDTALKEKDGSYYVLAMPGSIKGGSATGRHTLQLPYGLVAPKAEVMFENRTIDINQNGQFTDNFDHQHTYHIYKITP